jgi:MFS family permease
MITPAAPERLSADFWKFFVGQTISNLGTSITIFAMPLLVYQISGSALNLALATTFAFLPYLLFGLVLGAWVDRIDRKRLMVAVDVLQALAIGSVPLLYGLGVLSLWWIYAVVFVSGTLGICFQAAEFAAIPSLVRRDNLVRANGRIQASYSAAMVFGPLLGGLLLTSIPLASLLYLDALSFALSALLVAWVRVSFNSAPSQRSTSLRADIAEGLRYVWGHPVLRNISIMMALVNLVNTTVAAQLVLFATRRFEASEAQVGLFYSAGGAGVVLLALAAGALRQRFGFSKVALGALMLSGLCVIALAFTAQYWLALPIWALYSGLSILFNINTGSLRQAIVPGHMLGRVISVAMVLAWSANPLGTLLGGLAIDWSGNVAMVYAAIGVATVLIPLAFALGPLGRAEQYIPAAAAGDPAPAESEPALA